MGFFELRLGYPLVQDLSLIPSRLVYALPESIVEYDSTLYAFFQGAWFCFSVDSTRQRCTSRPRVGRTDKSRTMWLTRVPTVRRMTRRAKVLRPGAHTRHDVSTLISADRLGVRPRDQATSDVTISRATCWRRIAAQVDAAGDAIQSSASEHDGLLRTRCTDAPSEPGSESLRTTAVDTGTAMRSVGPRQSVAMLGSRASTRAHHYGSSEKRYLS